ncbi:tRNA adenosine(34) deaminase TadA [Buchnera aphidicola]|uniref:tRNA adenosine(34) deaminase TadA n=1 Tax=Buchnera aphidicola TaxID=9 RepID=UPI0030EB13B5
MKKNNDILWMNYAIFLSKISQNIGEVPVGAVLVYKKKIVVGVGWNQSICMHDPTAHAEIIALRNGGKYLKNYRLLNTELYVTLEPCNMCLNAILISRVKKIIFGAKNTSIKNNLKILKNNKKIQIKKNILKKKCKYILKDFFIKKRNI